MPVHHQKGHMEQEEWESPRGLRDDLGACGHEQEPQPSSFGLESSFCMPSAACTPALVSDIPQGRGGQ